MWQCAPKENEYVVIAGKGVAEDTAQICGYCRKTGDSGEGLCNGNASVEPESR